MFTKKGEYRNNTKRALREIDSNMVWLLHTLGQEMRIYTNLNVPNHKGIYSEELYNAALSAVKFFNCNHAHWGRMSNSKWYRKNLECDLSIAVRSLKKDGKDISLLALK